MLETATSWSTNEIANTIQQRQELLLKIKEVVTNSKKQILSSLMSDLRKPSTEAMITEVLPVLAEIDFAINNLEDWSRRREVASSAPTLGKYFLLPQPIGKVVVISAWNYPFQLSFLPTINALAAGNDVVLKPSEFAPATAMVIKRISEQLNYREFKVACGGKETARNLINNHADHIFFTGGQKAAKCILRTAAENLTPVTLELGGKCPCIVDDSIDVDFAARRIVWGKMLNAGQTCIAPDYVFVHRGVLNKFESSVASTIARWTKEDRITGKIVNLNHFDRILSLTERSGVSIPRSANREKLQFPLTVVRCDDVDLPLLNEEIFGPILPIVEFDELEDVIEILNDRPSPLAVYSFSNDKAFHERLMASTKSGGFCINDVILQAVDPAIPFGGVGQSGTGKYRGKAGFDCFSNYKTVFENSKCLENNRAYPLPLEHSDRKQK